MGQAVQLLTVHILTYNEHSYHVSIFKIAKIPQIFFNKKMNKNEETSSQKSDGKKSQQKPKMEQVKKSTLDFYKTKSFAVAFYIVAIFAFVIQSIEEIPNA